MYMHAGAAANSVMWQMGFAMLMLMLDAADVAFLNLPNMPVKYSELRRDLFRVKTAVYCLSKMEEQMAEGLCSNRHPDYTQEKAACS